METDAEVTFTLGSAETKTIIQGDGVRKIVVLKIFTWCNGATNLTWKDEDGVIFIPTMNFTASQGFVFDRDADNTPWIITAPGKSLRLQSSAAQSVVGKVYYQQS